MDEILMFPGTGQGVIDSMEFREKFSCHAARRNDSIIPLNLSSDLCYGEIPRERQWNFGRVFPLFSEKFSVLKNLLMPLFLMGCFPGDFQEGKQPIKAFVETAH